MMQVRERLRWQGVKEASLRIEGQPIICVLYAFRAFSLLSINAPRTKINSETMKTFILPAAAALLLLIFSNSPLAAADSHCCLRPDGY